MLPAALLVIDLRFRVICCNEQITLQASLYTQTRFQFVHEPGANAPAAKPRINCQVVDQPAPPIIAANHRAYNVPIGVSDEEEVRVTSQFFFDLRWGIRTTCVNTFFDAAPQCKDRLIISRKAKLADSNGERAHGDLINLIKLVTVTLRQTYSW